jgi:uncharacterized protein
MKDRRHSRRDALKLLGLGAGGAMALPIIAESAKPKSDLLFFEEGVKPRIPHYFGLDRVRLGEGPFLDAQRRDADYLLKLEPDRMLANFRKNAGLDAKAPVYGGWESVEPWIEIRCHGHTLGHYLGACASMFQSTGDARFAARVDYIVAELAACQRKRGDGLVCAFPDAAAPLLDSLAGKEFAGVPWYTMHKIMAGLRDAHVQRGSRDALDVLVRLTDWMVGACENVSDAAMQKMLEREHGGMTEVLADVFVLGGNARHLDLARRFVHRAVAEPLARHEDRLDGLHANTQIPKIIGLQRLYELEGLPANGNAADFFWHSVVETRSFATGGHGDGEHFFPKTQFAQHLGSAKTMETCCTHNMLRLTRALFKGAARGGHMDYFERALFNGILASQDPSSGMMTYFQATRPGYVKLFHTPFDSFWCCTGSGMENHARYGESIYAHDGDALFVNLFLASTLDWSELGVEVTQDTRFPDSDTTRLTFDVKRPRELTLMLRQPAWCPVMTVTVNGRAYRTCRKPGDYAKIVRRFGKRDVIEVRMPMSLHLEPLPDDSGHAALMYGPIVLAGIVGKPVNAAEQLIVNERKSGSMLNEPVKIPRWTRPLAELPASVERMGRESLRFRASGFAGGASVELIPYFRIANERYNLYWHV